MKFLPYVVKSLLRKRTRSILTIASILLPLFVIAILGTILATLDSDPSGGRGMFRLMVRHKASITTWLPRAYEPKIRNLRGVQEVVVANWFGGQYMDSRPENNFERYSVEPVEGLPRVFDEAKVVQGSYADWFADRSGLLVGEALMKRYGWRLGQKVPLKGDIYPINLELTIRAVFRAPNDAGVFFDHRVIEEALPRVKGFAGWYWVKTDSVEAAAKLPREIDALFDNSSWPTKTETEKESQNSFISMLGNVRLGLRMIILAMMFLILLVAANTMAMSARERVTEIAVLRALGFDKATVLGLVLAESLLIAVAGGAIGTVVFVFVLPLLRQALLAIPIAGAMAGGMRVFPGVLAFAFGTTVLVGVASGIVPAVRSAMRPITDGLRQVG